MAANCRAESRMPGHPPAPPLPLSSLHATSLEVLPGQPLWIERTVSKVEPQVSTRMTPEQVGVMTYQTSGEELEMPQEELPSLVAAAVKPGDRGAEGVRKGVDAGVVERGRSPVVDHEGKVLIQGATKVWHAVGVDIRGSHRHGEGSG